MFDTLRDHLDVIWGFLVALAVVLVLTPAVGRVARVLGIVDEPLERRRVHLQAVPRLGGLALFFGVFVPALAFLDLSGPYRGILLGAALATTVGMADDFRGLPWWVKLGGQAGAAAIAIDFGVRIDRFTFPIIGIHELPFWASVVLTLVWIVAIMNMVNFLDGLDGLAAGICGISGATFAVIALSLGKPEAAVLSAIIAGACLGFLRHNFYPARIFMGDSGALLMGFLLATVSIQGLLKTAATVALFFPLFALAVPIFDTSFVLLRRLKHREPLYLPGPGAPPSPLPSPRLHAAARRPLSLRVVRDPRRRGPRHALRALPRVGPVAPLADASSSRSSARSPSGATFYIVIVLEILKLTRVRAWAGRTARGQG